MRIRSMTATFGKLEHSTLTLEPGFHCISAPNEWGKSTWCAFVTAMLYGLDTRARTTRTALAEKEKYRPWSGSPMEGSMELTWRGRDITIQRRTTGRVPLGEFRAFETDTGLPVPELTAENCGRMLLGVERSVFQRAGFLRLEELPVTQDEALRRRLNGLVTRAEEDTAGDVLRDKLRELKNRCRHNHTGRIPQVEAELATCMERQSRIQELQLRQTHLEQQLHRRSAEWAALEEHRQSSAKTQTEADRSERQHPQAPWIWLALLAAACICILAARFGRLFLLLLAIPAALLIWGLRRTGQPGEDLEQARAALEEDRGEKTLERLRQLQSQRDNLRLELGQCQGQLQALGDAAALEKQIATLRQRLAQLKQTERALELALQTLEAAETELQRRFSPQITARAQELFSQLTDGRYPALALDQELALTTRAQEEDTMRSALWRSSGTADQLYLALRLAVAEALTPEAPLILDDALARFDPKRREAALAILRQQAKRTQVILFTSTPIS